MGSLPSVQGVQQCQQKSSFVQLCHQELATTARILSKSLWWLDVNRDWSRISFSCFSPYCSPVNLPFQMSLCSTPVMGLLALINHKKTFGKRRRVLTQVFPPLVRYLYGRPEGYSTFCFGRRQKLLQPWLRPPITLINKSLNLLSSEAYHAHGPYSRIKVKNFKAKLGRNSVENRKLSGHIAGLSEHSRYHWVVASICFLAFILKMPGGENDD